jgi:ATP-dependent Lon protease
VKQEDEMMLDNIKYGDKGSVTMEIPLLPLRDVVVFPHMIVPLFVGRERSIAALESAMKDEKEIFMVAQKSAQKDEPGEDEIYRIGTIGIIIQLLRLPDGTVKVLVEGKKRGIVREYLPCEEYFLVRADELEEIVHPGDDVKSEALMRSIRESFETYAKMTKKVHLEMVGTIASIEDPSKLADVVISQVNAKLEDKQKILEICHIPERMETIYELMLSEIEILHVEEKIKRRVKKQMEKTQKDYYLNEQMRAIQKEMGEKDEFRNEIVELEKRLKQKKLSEEAHRKVKQEIKKMQMMAPMSAEATVVRNYIDWLLDMPWSEKTENSHTLKASEAILEEDHYGLKQVKERIIEYLAVQTLVKKNKGPILCLVGPPGVGMRRKSEDIEGPILGPCRGKLFSFSRKPVRTIRSSAWMRWTSSAPISGEILLPPCWRFLIRSRTIRSTTTIWRSTTTSPISCSSPRPTFYRPSPRHFKTGWR